MREAAQRKATIAASISASSRRDRCRVSRDFLRQLLCGPREGQTPCGSGSDAGGGASLRRPCRPPPPLPPLPVDQYRFLLGKEEVEEEERQAGVGQATVVPSLMELCCRQMAQDFLIYGLLEKKEEQDYAFPGAQGEDKEEVEGEGEGGADGAGYGEEDEEEEEEVPLREVMSLLPVRVVERIAWLASREHTITDENLPFLCHPTIERLVLIGDYTDHGLARYTHTQTCMNNIRRLRGGGLRGDH